MACKSAGKPIVILVDFSTFITQWEEKREPDAKAIAAMRSELRQSINSGSIPE